MLKFKYTVTINALPASDDKQFVESLTGTLEAPDQNSAYERAKIFAWDRCQELVAQRGGIFGYEDVRVELAQGEVVTAQPGAKYPLTAFDHAGVLRLTPVASPNSAYL